MDHANLSYRIKNCKSWAKNLRRIDLLGISPFFAILVLAISLLLIFSFYAIDWSNTGEGVKFTSIISLLAFIILLFYTYYTFQIAKSTAKGQALLYVQIQHSNVLKEFLKGWESSLGSGRHTYDIPVINQEDSANYENESFNNSWEYRDFINHHLPTGYENLVPDYSNFKNINHELNKLSYDLYSKLRLNLWSEISDISNKIDIKPDTSHFDYFVVKVYRICFEYINGRIENLKSELVPTCNETYLLRVDGMETPFKGDKMNMEYAKLKMDAFITRNNLIYNYKNELNQIGTKLDEREIMRNKLRKNLNELIQRPLFAGTKCDMLKDFDN
jgi:hypothetical protein